MNERFFQYQGLNIRYLDAGATAPRGSDTSDRALPIVVMLHGWGSNADLFDRAMDFMAVKYHVVAPDMPGFGKSEEPTTPYDLDDYVDFAVRFTEYILQSDSKDTKNIQDAMDTVEKDYMPSVIFLGHSHGGRVILRLLSRQARGQNDFAFKVTKAIQTDSAGIVPEKSATQKKRTARYKRYKALITKTGLAKIAPGLMEKLQKKYGSADYAAASPVMRQSMVKVVNTDLRAEMPLIRIPVLLIWGDADTATPLADGQEMERLMPEAGLAVIPGGTHFCFLENPNLYNRIIGSFLGISFAG